ncbi:MAG TPA: hypothetical protein VEP73_04870 [Actinomycetota bacterium]|nr:hypothetical protein [Actinomycetota bacterium]
MPANEGGPPDAAAVAGVRRTPGQAFSRATGAAAVLAVAVGAVGTVAVRHWGRIPFGVPSRPWYLSWPYYLFWDPRLDLGWALAALPVAALAAVVVVALAAPRTRPAAAPVRGAPAEPPVRGAPAEPPVRGAPGPALSRRVRLGASAAAVFVLALAVSALGGGPAAWRAPLAYAGEYPDGVRHVGAIPTFLARFSALQPSLPDFPAQHPPGATVLYALVDRVWPGLTGAALATTAAACLGALVVAGLARDELGEAGDRLAVACWALAPIVVLYAATAADAMWAPVLAGSALAAHRGLERQSLAWTVAGGALLWVGSMLTFGAVLLLPFLLVRALARLGAGRAWVVRWAVVTAAVALGLAALCWAATGYEPVSAVRAVDRFWRVAPGSQRVWWIWLFGDLIAFGGMLGFPLLAAFAVRAWTVVRERAWGSFEAATLASLLAGAAWGHTKGEVERMWQFLVPFAVVVAARQLLRWRVRLPVVAALLVGQALAVQVLFFTRW